MVDKKIIGGTLVGLTLLVVIVLIAVLVPKSRGSQQHNTTTTTTNPIQLYPNLDVSEKNLREARSLLGSDKRFSEMKKSIEGIPGMEKKTRRTSGKFLDKEGYCQNDQIMDDILGTCPIKAETKENTEGLFKVPAYLFENALKNKSASQHAILKKFSNELIIPTLEMLYNDGTFGGILSTATQIQFSFLDLDIKTLKQINEAFLASFAKINQFECGKELGNIDFSSNNLTIEKQACFYEGLIGAVEILTSDEEVFKIIDYIFTEIIDKYIVLFKEIQKLSTNPEEQQNSIVRLKRIPEDYNEFITANSEFQGVINYGTTDFLHELSEDNFQLFFKDCPAVDLSTTVSCGATDEQHNFAIMKEFSINPPTKFLDDLSKITCVPTVSGSKTSIDFHLLTSMLTISDPSKCISEIKSVIMGSGREYYIEVINLVIAKLRKTFIDDKICYVKMFEQMKIRELVLFGQTMIDTFLYIFVDFCSSQ